MKRVVIAFFCFFLFSVRAQIVNIENKRIYDDSSGISGSIAANFNAIRNQDLLLSAGLNPLIQYKTPMHYYLLYADWNYSKGANNTFSNAGMIHFRYAYRLNKIDKYHKKSPWKLEAYAQVQYNELLRQKLRALSGVGIRWKIFDIKANRSFLGSSTFYEYEELATLEVNKQIRWSNYWSWFINSNNITFTGVNYYQPSINNFKDTRFMGQYTFGYRLKRNVSLRADFMVFYDSRPAQNVKNTVFNSSFGLQIGLVD
ncbi:MAG: DUF481 domain-containing protein [Bacteroidota bacterium]